MAWRGQVRYGMARIMVWMGYGKARLGKAWFGKDLGTVWLGVARPGKRMAWI